MTGMSDEQEEVKGIKTIAAKAPSSEPPLLLSSAKG